MAATVPVSQNKRRRLYRNGFVIVIAFLAAVAIASRVFGWQLHGLALPLMIAAFVLALLQFSALDEMARQAQYVAWYWGSMVALGLIALAHVAGFAGVAVEPALARWLGAMSASDAFMAGLLAAPMLMLAAYSVWWAAYWLRRR